jgi:LytS/YehU family sensor histidine kinase
MYSYRYRYIFIFLLSAYSFLNILFTEGQRLFGKALNEIELLITISILVFFIWEGSRILNSQIGKVKFKRDFHPLLLLFILTVFYVLVLSSLASLVVTRIFDLQSFYSSFKLTFGFTFRVNLFLNCVNAIAFYINKSRETQLRAEELEKKNIEAQFEILRNQVSPHFLFNSLNVLASIVHENPDLASDFIERFSKVYRYILNNRDTKLIEVKEELDFLKSYLFLLQIRYPDNLILNIDVPEKYYTNLIPPATLQILIENAIKHNTISEKKPLKIELGNHFGNYLTVRNNMQPKSSDAESTQLGLKNIRERYKILTDQEVIVEKDESEFRVRVPLIKNEYENPDSRR